MTTIIPDGPGTDQVGIALCLPTSDETWDKEIQYDTDSNFGDPETVRVSGTERRVRLLLADDDTRRHFRWRTVRGDCSTPGSWSATVSAKPTQLPRSLPSCPEIPFQPEVTLEPTQSGATGTATLEVKDSRARVTALEFQTKTGAGSYSGSWVSTWDSSTGTAGTDTSLTRAEDISLVGKHNVSIKVRVQYTDKEGTTQSIILAHTFDVDEIAEVEIQGVGYDGSDNVVFAYKGDEDTSSIRYNLTTDGTEPSDPTSGDSSSSGRKGVVTTSTTASPGDTVWLKVAGVTSGGSVATGDAIAETQVERAQGEVVPSIQIDPTQSGATGTLALTVTDPQLRATAIEFQKKAGAGDFGGTWLTTWDSSTGAAGSSPTPTRSESVNIPEKHNSAIKIRVTYDDSDGNGQTVGAAHTFDRDEIPSVAISTVTFNDSGNPVVSVTGDEDTADIHVTASVGSDPSDPTSTDDSIGARTGTVTISGTTVELGETVHVKAVGATTVGGSAEGEVDEARQERGKGVISPTIELEPSQSGSTGTMTVQVHDPQLRATSLQFAKKTDASGFGSFASTWDTSTGTVGSSEDLTRSEDVTLTDKHVVAIKVRLIYDDASGNSQTIGGSHTFDVDEVPDVEIQTVTFNNSGNPVVTVKGDEDTADVYVTANVGSDPSGDPTSTDDSTGSRIGTVTISGTTVDLGETVHVEARGATTVGGTASGEVASARQERGKGVIVPTIELEPSQSGSTGTLNVEVADPQLRATSLEFAKKTNAGDFGSFVSTWDSSTGTAGTDASLSRSEDISLKNKHNVAIKVRLTYTDADGTSQTIGASHSFDIDERAEVTALEVSVDGSGNVVTSGRRDEDGANTYFTVATGADLATDGTDDPSDPTSATNDASTSSQSWNDLDTTVDASAGDDVILKAAAETSGGTPGPVVRRRITHGTDPEIAQNLIAELDRTSSTDSTVTVSMDATTGPNTVGPVEAQLESMVMDGSGAGFSVEQAWVGSLPHSETVNKASYPKLLRLRVRDTGANNAIGGPDFLSIAQDLTVAEWVDADALDGSRNVDFGSSSVVNRTLANAGADGGDLSDIPDGGGYGKVNGLALGTNGGIDFSSTLGWIAKHAANLDRDSGNSTAVSTIISGIQDTGILNPDLTANLPNVSKANRAVAQTNAGGTLLTSSDAGSSATINIAEHTVKVGTNSEVTMGSGSVTGLDYFSPYLVYVDDDLKNNNASPNYQAVKAGSTEAQAMDNEDRYYLGHITTPQDGGSDETSGGDRSLV